jgi:hypothetical protein
MPQSHLFLITWTKWLIALLITSSILSGCNDRKCIKASAKDTAVYDECLFRYESVAKVRQFGPFTALTVRYVEPYGYWGADFTYERILYEGQILKKKVDSVSEWRGLAETVLFVEFLSGDESSLHLVYEHAGRPIAERIDVGNYGWAGTSEFPHGFPLSAGVRYFPRYVGAKDAGFLLAALPTRVTKLPLGPQGVRVPWVQILAGIAPDGKSYAYSDSRETPSAVVVVDADGAVHEPIPIPFTSLGLKADPDTGALEPLWNWFGKTFIWQRNPDGRWEIVPKWASHSGQTENSVENVFIDAANGYKVCFANDNSACLSGWLPMRKTDTQANDCCLSPYVYSPLKPIRVFNGDLIKLVYSESITPGSGYQVELDASSDVVVKALTERLQQREVPFVRVDKCPDLVSNERECIAILKRTVRWKDPIDQSVVDNILRAAKAGVVVVTPTAALGIYAGQNGQTWIDTLARYAH